jgi:enoyl-CoA hydratase/carnithine racemase
MTDLVQVSRADGVATVTLNRPDKLNALNKAMWQGVEAAFRDLARDEAVRCVVLTSAGGKAFSPGADIAEFGTERADVAQATSMAG